METTDTGRSPRKRKKKRGQGTRLKTVLRLSAGQKDPVLLSESRAAEHALSRLRSIWLRVSKSLKSFALSHAMRFH